MARPLTGRHDESRAPLGRGALRCPGWLRVSRASTARKPVAALLEVESCAEPGCQGVVCHRDVQTQRQSLGKTVDERPSDGLVVVYHGQQGKVGQKLQLRQHRASQAGPDEVAFLRCRKISESVAYPFAVKFRGHVTAPGVGAEIFGQRCMGADPEAQGQDRAVAVIRGKCREAALANV